MFLIYPRTSPKFFVKLTPELTSSALFHLAMTRLVDKSLNVCHSDSETALPQLSRETAVLCETIALTTTVWHKTLGLVVVALIKSAIFTSMLQR